MTEQSADKKISKAWTREELQLLVEHAELNKVNYNHGKRVNWKIVCQYLKNRSYKSCVQQYSKMMQLAEDVQQNSSDKKSSSAHSSYKMIKMYGDLIQRLSEHKSQMQEEREQNILIHQIQQMLSPNQEQ